MIGPTSPTPYVPPEKRGYVPDSSPKQESNSPFGNDWHITNPDIPLSKAFKWAFKMCLVFIPLVVFLGIISANVFWHAPIFWVRKPEFPKLDLSLENNDEAQRLQQAAQRIDQAREKMNRARDELQRSVGIPTQKSITPPPTRPGQTPVPFSLGR